MADGNKEEFKMLTTIHKQDFPEIRAAVNGIDDITLKKLKEQYSNGSELDRGILFQLELEERVQKLLKGTIKEFCELIKDEVNSWVLMKAYLRENTNPQKRLGITRNLDKRLRALMGE